MNRFPFRYFAIPYSSANENGPIFDWSDSEELPNIDTVRENALQTSNTLYIRTDGRSVVDTFSWMNFRRGNDHRWEAATDSAFKLNVLKLYFGESFDALSPEDEESAQEDIFRTEREHI